MADCSIQKESVGVRPNRVSFPQVLVNSLVKVLVKVFVKVPVKVPVRVLVTVLVRVLVKVEVLLLHGDDYLHCGPSSFIIVRSWHRLKGFALQRTHTGPGWPVRRGLPRL